MWVGQCDEVKCELRADLGHQLCGPQFPLLWQQGSSPEHSAKAQPLGLLKVEPLVWIALVSWAQPWILCISIQLLKTGVCEALEVSPAGNFFRSVISFHSGMMGSGLPSPVHSLWGPFLGVMVEVPGKASLIRSLRQQSGVTSESPFPPTLTSGNTDWCKCLVALMFRWKNHIESRRIRING